MRLGRQNIQRLGHTPHIHPSRQKVGRKAGPKRVKDDLFIYANLFQKHPQNSSTLAIFPFRKCRDSLVQKSPVPWESQTVAVSLLEFVTS